MANLTRPFAPSLLAAVALVALAAGCARVPEPRGATSRAAEAADYPALLTEDQMPVRSEAEPDGAAIAGSLQARAAALRARARALFLVTP
ncbi:MAG: hypothetical protein KDE08_14035 [Rhodobacteraceae bacterium]|nr:hypothetical protein [Paracoccaceae bacterium]